MKFIEATDEFLNSKSSDKIILLTRKCDYWYRYK